MLQFEVIALNDDVYQSRVICAFSAFVIMDLWRCSYLFEFWKWKCKQICYGLAKEYMYLDNDI